jgi:hypothetical protein
MAEPNADIREDEGDIDGEGASRRSLREAGQA